MPCRRFAVAIPTNCERRRIGRAPQARLWIDVVESAQMPLLRLSWALYAS